MDALAPTHLILIGVAALVLFFGWKQLPDMARSVGRSLRLFKSEMNSPAADAPADAPAEAAETKETTDVA